MLRALTLLACLCIAPLARAHPHVFVDVSLRFEQDAEGRISGVEVTWVYDTLFSLLVLSDRGLDPDADLVLTAAEQAALLGFDLQDWPDGFEGALFAYTAGQPVQFGPAEALSVDLRDGAIVTRHRREMAPLTLTEGDVLRLQPYDPYYYAALSLTSADGLPDSCAAQITPPDTEKADALLADLGGAQNEQVFEEVKVGIHYAFAIEVTCVGR